MMIRVLVLACLLPLIAGLDKGRLEQIRLLHEHDGIDTATVHIAYPHSLSLRRLTKREAVENLLPRRHDNLTVKVTLNSSRRVFDLRLQPSKLQMHGALVKVMHEEGHESDFRVEDEGCHYQGFFDDGQGLASVHFCDGVLVGGAHTGDTEYHFHSHQHRLPHETDDNDNDNDNNINREDPLNLLQGNVGQDLYHTVVSWTDISKSLPFGANDDPTILTDDYLEIEEEEETEEEEEEEKRRGRVRRQAVIPSTLAPDENGGEEGYDITADEEIVVPSEASDNVQSNEYNANNTPVVEFGIIVDEDFIRDHKFLYPTRQDIIRMLMIKYTGVQALYGNPEVTGFNMTIQVKLLYLWEKNPSYYNGSRLKIGRRMGVGKQFSEVNALYKSTDVGALYTSNSQGNVVGMAFLTGACRWGAKTFVTRKYGSAWNTESHELGHTLGMSHVPATCQNATPPYDIGFMNAIRSMFLPCYAQALRNYLQTNRLQCLYREDVNTTNIPPVRLQSTFPVLAFGMNYYCQSAFRSDSAYAFEEDTLCGLVMCAVTDESNPEYGMSMPIRSIVGRSCGPNGEICIQKSCKLPTGNTTITARDKLTGSGSWGRWSSYANTCTTACGAGVQISSRQCSNRDRAEACLGPRHRARLCNTEYCPGDELKEELEIREDRSNYTCSLLHARGGNLTQYIYPYSKTVRHRQLIVRISMGSCLVPCAVAPSPEGSPGLPKTFASVMQADGTLCGPLNNFDRQVLGITTRCLRGRCMEFGCDGYSMESRSEGKVKDMCGVCGGKNNTCNAGLTTLRLARADDIDMVTELPAGTRDISFAVQPDTTGNHQDRNIKLALMDKDDSYVIVPGYPGLWRINTNTDNPLNYAGTHWTTVSMKVMTAPGPIDQPMKLKAMMVGRSQTPADVVITWGYKLPRTVPPPPACENGGTANTTNGGCMCAGGYHGKLCEFSCHKLCFNGGVMLKPECECDCSGNPRTFSKSPCNCLDGFAGPDCNLCALQHCYNGGTLNASTCRCQCPSECRSRPDCSDCNYNPLLPSYRGQYGRGSLEDPLKPRSTTENPEDSTQQVDDTTKQVDDSTRQVDDTTKQVDDSTQQVDDTTKQVDTSGQPTVHKTAVIHLPEIIVALWLSGALFGLPHF